MTQFWVGSGLVVYLTYHRGFIFVLYSCSLQSKQMPFCGASLVSCDIYIDSRAQGPMLLTHMQVSHNDIV